MYTTLISVLLSGLAMAQTPPGFTPESSTLLPVSYGNNIVSPGLHLSVNATSSAPTVSFPPSSLVVMLDLDAPMASLNRSYAPLLHWIATSGNQTVIQYGGPQPPASSPDHRYVLLSYSLPHNTTKAFAMPKGFEKVGDTVMNRAKFDLSGFVNGSGVTGPISANWFTVPPVESRNATSPPLSESVATSFGTVDSCLAAALAAGLVALSM